MDILVSVIVPIYNAGYYLEKCINSILGQSYKNIELILVDDGSIDNSRDICGAYAAMDSRVHTFYKENRGVSSARNVGIINSSGSLLCFVDADDALPEDAIEIMCSKALELEVDMVIGRLSYDGRHRKSVSSEEIVDISKQPKTLMRLLTKNNMYSACAKLYKAEILQMGSLRFREDLRCAEDSVFVRDYLLYAKKVVVIPEVVYSVDRSNEASASKKRYEDYCESYVEKMKSLERLCDKMDFSVTTKRDFLFYRAVHGLRISFYHYMHNWPDTSAQYGFVRKSVVQLKPWLQNTAGSQMLSWSLRIWWNKIRQSVLNADYDSLYIALCKEKQKQDELRKFKQFVKLLARR